jgi:hypothetical protein
MGDQQMTNSIRYRGGGGWSSYGRSGLRHDFEIPRAIPAGVISCVGQSAYRHKPDAGISIPARSATQGSVPTSLQQDIISRIGETNGME